MIDRNSTGQFVPGNGGGGARPGAGRKPAAVKLQMQQLLDAAISESDWVAIFKKHKEQAIAGDVKSATFLADRKFGKPKESLEVSSDAPLPILGINIVQPPMSEPESPPM